MPYKLISLVFLLIFTIVNKIHSDEGFLLPEKNHQFSKKLKNPQIMKKQLIYLKKNHL